MLVTGDKPLSVSCKCYLFPVLNWSIRLLVALKTMGKFYAPTTISISF